MKCSNTSTHALMHTTPSRMSPPTHCTRIPLCALPPLPPPRSLSACGGCACRRTGSGSSSGPTSGGARGRWVRMARCVSLSAPHQHTPVLALLPHAGAVGVNMISSNVVFGCCAWAPCSEQLLGRYWARSHVWMPAPIVHVQLFAPTSTHPLAFAHQLMSSPPTAHPRGPNVR